MLPLAQQVGARMAKGGAAFEKNRAVGSMEQKLIKMRAVLNSLAVLVLSFLALLAAWSRSSSRCARYPVHLLSLYPVYLLY
jgi:hypothetical protein